MNKRLNITIPEETVRLIDRAVPKGSRSRLIDEAIRQYLATVGRATIRKKLEEGYHRNAAQDLEIAAEWFAAEDDVWRQGRK